MIENRETEFKREVNDKVNKTLLAFLNTDGGVLFVGINDDGAVYGVENVDSTMLQISSSFRDSVIPDPTPHFKVDPIEREGKNLIQITVERGAMIPYCFKAEGLVPKGVYVRVAASSVQATREHIKQMIRESSGDVFIEELSVVQNLTFDYASKVFAEKEIAFGESQMRTLGIVRADGRYTNLGLVISDQCPYIIKAAIFQGTNKKLFKDRKEFTGSVFKQIDECMQYLHVFNKVSSIFKGAYRIDRADYPNVSIREALMNAIIHRDYYIEGAILVSLFDDRLEIMSIGGLMPGVTLQLMRHGISIPRNDSLAKIFHRLNLIDAYGTGLPRIFEAYGEHGLTVEIPITDGGFLISMPNINYALGEFSETVKNNNVVAVKTTLTEKKVLNQYTKQTFTKEDVALKFGTGTNGAYKLLTRMVEKGLLSSELQGKKIVYKCVAQDTRT